MIHLVNESPMGVRSFETYDQVLACLNRIENTKNVGEGATPPSKWHFLLFPYRRLCALNDHLGEQSFTRAEKAAFEKGLDLVEIYRGDPHNPAQVALVPNLDLEAVKKSWCLDYCEAHKLTLLEVHQGFPPKRKEKGG